MKTLNYILIFLILVGLGYIFLVQNNRPDTPDPSPFIFEPALPIPTQVSQTMSDRVKIAVIGDYGDPSPSPADHVANQIHRVVVDAIVTTGDNAYPSGTYEDLVRANERYTDFVQNCTLFPALGNHDWGYPDANSYTAQTLPTSAFFGHCPTQSQRYYSAVLGNGLVKIIVLDTDRREPDLTQMADFLARESASGEPYKFVFMHEPAYSSCEGKSTSRSQLDYNSVTAVFSGHCHLYERLTVDGATYIIQGAGGGGQTDQPDFVFPGSVITYTAQKGTVFIDVNQTSAQILFIALDGTVIDQVSFEAYSYNK